MKYFLHFLWLVVLFFPLCTQAEVQTFSGSSLSGSTLEKKIIKQPNKNTIVSSTGSKEKTEINTKVKIPQSTTWNIENKSLIENSYWKRKKQIKKLLESSQEEKDIESIKLLQQELQIQKELDRKYLTTISKELLNLQTQIKNNNNIIDNAKKVQTYNKELALKIKIIDTKNNHLLLQSRLKEKIIIDLKSTLDDYAILESKYKNLYKIYLNIKQKKLEDEKKNYTKKLFFFYIFLTLYSIIFVIKLLLTLKLGKKFETSFLYFDFIYSITLILGLIGFFFYFFPQLYIMLLFISWYLLYINQSIIGSFMWSIVVLRNYNIGDIIKYKDDFWKIIKITPLFTWVRILYDNWILSNRVENIPNILITKEPVMVYNNPELKEYNCVIYLPIHKDINVFKIVEEIKENILIKSLTTRPEYLEKSNNDLFSLKYRQEDVETIQITFFWIDRNLVSRKIQRRIFWHIKEVLDKYNIWENNSKSLPWEKNPEEKKQIIKDYFHISKHLREE